MPFELILTHDFLDAWPEPLGKCLLKKGICLVPAFFIYQLLVALIKGKTQAGGQGEKLAQCYLRLAIYLINWRGNLASDRLARRIPPPLANKGRGGGWGKTRWWRRGETPAMKL
ncbi:hypothetical protein A8A01_28370 [Ewingella americana]|nr:hypothetical protein A8A01_28370 [Ewingella americana]